VYKRQVRNMQSQWSRRDVLKRSGEATLGLLTAHIHTPPVSKQLSPAMAPAQRHTTEHSNLITLFLCGDVMTGRGIDQVLPHPSDPRLHERFMRSAIGYVELAEQAYGVIPKPVSFAYIWGDALKEFNRLAPDVRVINLETSVTTSEDWISKGINYRMHPKNIPCLSVAKIDCCILANNHVLDWGYTGLTETLETLAAANVRTAGAGRNLDEASAPAIMNTRDGARVIVLCYGLLLAYQAVSNLRQHIQHTEGIHGIVTEGGQAPNIVPDRAAGDFYVRA